MVKVVRKKNNAMKNPTLELKNLKKNMADVSQAVALAFAYLYGKRYYKAGNNWYRTNGAKVVIKKGLK